MKKALLALGLALHMVVFVLMNPVATILTITFGGLYLGYHFMRGLVDGIVAGITEGFDNTLKAEA